MSTNIYTAYNRDLKFTFSTILGTEYSVRAYDQADAEKAVIEMLRVPAIGVLIPIDRIEKILSSGTWTKS